MCPIDILQWKKERERKTKHNKTRKLLQYFLLDCSFQSMCGAFTVQDCSGDKRDSQDWLCAHTCPYYISHLFSCSSVYLQNRVNSGIWFQLPVVPQVFFIFPGLDACCVPWRKVVGSRHSHPYPLLVACQLLAGLYYCSTLVLENVFPICNIIN